MVIAGFAGCGKTTFCEKNPGDAIDLVCMPFKYSDFYEVAGSLKEGEKIKANERLMLRENWELYYYWMIRYLLWYSPERQIVIPTIRKIMSSLRRTISRIRLYTRSENGKRNMRDDTGIAEILRVFWMFLSADGTICWMDWNSMGKSRLRYKKGSIYPMWSPVCRRMTFTCPDSWSGLRNI